MDARPEWVPEWIWDDYQSYREFMQVCDPPERVDRDIRLVESVLQDKDCATVWLAIDRRKGEPTRRYRQWCKTRGLPDNLARSREAEQLFDAFTYFSSGIPRGVAIPSSERRAIAKRIKTHALALRAELEALDAQCDAEGYPHELSECFGGLADEVASNFAERNAEFALTHDWLKERRGDKWDGFAVGVMAGLMSIEDTMGAISGAAEKWAQTKPPVSRPNDENATRLYFMREITNYFRKHYGTPLREPAAVLTRKIFKCDVDAATIAKLAP
jgi:hypothetical protein